MTPLEYEVLQKFLCDMEMDEEVLLKPLPTDEENGRKSPPVELWASSSMPKAPVPGF